MQIDITLQMAPSKRGVHWKLSLKFPHGNLLQLLALFLLCEPTLAQVGLLDRMMEITPPSLTRFFFANSGSEAVDNAIKIARGHTKRQNIICFEVCIGIPLWQLWKLQTGIDGR